MAEFYGSNNDDSIRRTSLSLEVSTVPGDLTGTMNSAESNLIFGYGGNDTLEAGDYGDQLFGGDGNDALYGGAGGDWMSGDKDDLYDEDGVGDDVMYGGAGDDYMGGDGGSDALYGGDGNDYLDGGTGADKMFGGDGSNVYLIDSRFDQIFEETIGDDSIFTFLKVYRLPEGFVGLTFFAESFADSFRGTGDAGANSITGTAGDDVLFGLGGDDYLSGGFGGADKLYGGDGNDTISFYDAGVATGGRGADTFDFYGIAGVVKAGNGAAAFEGAGKTGGDLIELNFDADWTDQDYTHLIFGGTDKGHFSLMNSGGDTLVVANMDDDADFEYELTIKDGGVDASKYWEHDFILV